MLDDTRNDLGGEAAGFWRRFAASFIDGIVVSIVGALLSVVFGYRSAHGTGVWLSGGNGIGLVVAAGYFTFFHGRTGQTPGNGVLGIRVVDCRDSLGQPLGYGRAFVRWVVSIPSGIVLLLGYLWMLWDPRKQTWHDKAAGSLPVHVGY
jgi:uncharacterized RDD family membrane protein YckC